MIDKELLSTLDAEIAKGLKAGTRQMTQLVDDDDVATKDKIAAYNALIGASSLKQQRQEEVRPSKQQPQLGMNDQLAEVLVGALVGLARLAGTTVDPKSVLGAADLAPQAQLPTPQMMNAPTVTIEVDVPKPASDVPAYAATASVPLSIQVKRQGSNR